MTSKSWICEAINRETDAESGAAIIQLTSSCLISHNIYGEQPANTPDGKRITIIRTPSTDWHDFVCEYWVIDLASLTMAKAAAKSMLFGKACSAWGGYSYYVADEGRTLRRFSWQTLDDEKLFDFAQHPLPQGSASVTSDNHYYAYMTFPPRFAVARIDLITKQWEIIHQHPEILNPHINFNHASGKDILIQHNRGSKMDENGNVTSWLGPEGCTLYLIDRDGKNKRSLPIGPPFTASCTGHECFVGTGGKVLFSTVLEPGMKGSLYIAGVGDEQPRLVCQNNMYFGHVACSKCGNYFIADGFFEQGTPIYIGNINTGKFRRLVTSSASSGSPEYTHACPYMTADNKWLIYTSDRTGIPQVYAASIPDAFLKSLE